MHACMHECLGHIHPLNINFSAGEKAQDSGQLPEKAQQSWWEDSANLSTHQNCQLGSQGKGNCK